MKIEELPQGLRDLVESLKHGSNTIESDIGDALENAQNVNEFKEKALRSLDALINEARDIKSTLKGERERRGMCPVVPVEMDEFREMAAEVIDYVTEAIQSQYPKLKPKKEFLEQSPDAAILYGESYFNLEAMIEEKLRKMFDLKGTVDRRFDSIQRLYEGYFNADQGAEIFAGEFYFSVGEILSGKELKNLKLQFLNMEDLGVQSREQEDGGWKGDMRIISYRGEPKAILEISGANSLDIQALLDEYMKTTMGYFGDSDFIRLLQSKGVKVRSHPFDEWSAGEQ